MIHQTSKNIILKSIGYGEKIIDLNKRLKTNSLLIEKSTFFINNDLTSPSWLLTSGSKGHYNLGNDSENQLSFNKCIK